MNATFPLGRIVATPGALAALERANQSAALFLTRHGGGDWGELDRADIAENEYSMAHGFRLLSSYTTAIGEKLWIITEVGPTQLSRQRRDNLLLGKQLGKLNHSAEVLL
jgi:hypothetical protein